MNIPVMLHGIKIADIKERSPMISRVYSKFNQSLPNIKKIYHVSKKAIYIELKKK